MMLVHDVTAKFAIPLKKVLHLYSRSFLCKRIVGNLISFFLLYPNKQNNPISQLCVGTNHEACLRWKLIFAYP